MKNKQTNSNVESSDINTDDLTQKEDLESSSLDSDISNVEIPQMPNESIEPVVTTNSKLSNEQNDFADVKPKKKIVLIIAIIILVIGLAVGAFFIWKAISDTTSNSPKSRFLNAVNNFYSGFATMVDETQNSSLSQLMNQNTVLMKGNVAFDINLSDLFSASLPNEGQELSASQMMPGLLDEINKLDFDFQYGIDMKNKLAEIGFGANYVSDPLASIMIYFKDEKGYVYLEDLYDKYIRAEVENFDEIFTQEENLTDDAMYFLELCKNALLDSLDEKDFVETKESININAKTIETTKISYTITSDNVKTISLAVLEKIVNDNRALEFMESISEKSKEIIKEDLEKTINDIKNKEVNQNDNKIVMNVYLQDSTTVKLELLIDSKNENGVMQTVSFEYGKINDIYEVIIAVSDGTQMVILNQKDASGKYVTTINFMDVVTAEITETKKENEIIFDYVISIESEGQSISLEGSLNEKMTEIQKDKEYNDEFSLTMSMKMAGLELMSMEISGDMDLEFGVEIGNIDTSNYINAENLTETEQQQILTKLMSNEAFINFILALEPYLA